MKKWKVSTNFLLLFTPTDQSFLLKKQEFNGDDVFYERRPRLEQLHHDEADMDSTLHPFPVFHLVHAAREIDF